MSSQPTTGTSKVIENLHLTIDSLKADLNETKITLAETRQKNSILTKRNENLVEQLSNSKHQTEVAESLLKRKDRRILDLENQLTELSSANEKYKFETDTLKLNLKNLDGEKFQLAAENQRLSKSHEILQSSLNDYKLSLNSSINSLKFQIPNFINEARTMLQENVNSLKLNQPEINTSYNLLIKNSKRLEELYNQKFTKVNNYLLLLTESTKQHGQATSIVMEECDELLKQINRNEDVLLKIKNQTVGNLTDLDKMKEFTKLRDISILTSSPASSPLIKQEEKRKISPGILDSKYNTASTSRSISPDIPDSPRNFKRNNSINIQKRNNRKRNSYRYSMNQDDFANMSINDETKKRIPSDKSVESTNNNHNTNGTGTGNHNGNNHNLHRSNSSRKNRNSRIISNGSYSGGYIYDNGNNNGNGFNSVKSPNSSHFPSNRKRLSHQND